jgi:ribosome-associated toxin RatA of RatAB toxin-antitoxin module
MHTVDIIAHVSGGSPGAIFEVLTDFERYPELTDAVRAVEVLRETPTRLSSTWEVNFRHGILKWSEHDELDFERRVIAFTQTDGDLEHFSGSWSVDAHPTGCVVRFAAAFDLGMPSLARMLDPIAESALRENVADIIRGMIELPVEILSAPSAVLDERAA